MRRLLKNQEGIDLEFNFSQEAYKRLDEITRRTNAPNMAEVVRKALELYDHVTHHISNRTVIPVCIVIGKDNGELKVW